VPTTGDTSPTTRPANARLAGILVGIVSDWLVAILSAAQHAVSYYVTLTSTLLAKADFLRHEPLTADEVSLHRPDLPFAVVRRPDAAWPTVRPDVTTFVAAFGTTAVLTAPEFVRSVPAAVPRAPYG
jgi:hypothetical protein